MAQEQLGALPVYYGERMNDGTVIESPRVRPTGSRDALLRLPIQPNEAHVHPGVPSPISPVAPEDPLQINPGQLARPRGSTVGDSSRWVTFPAGEQDDYPLRPRRSDRYAPSDYRGSVSRRAPYVEDYSEGEDYPRATRRTNRRHTRPPPAHGRAPGPGRTSHEQTRSSFDSRADYDYESDTPKKARFRYSDDDDYEPDYRRPRTAYAAGGGRKGPPRSPPSTEEVMRLPWTMWMNSNAKNHFVAFIGEFVGTTMFLFFAFSGTQVANIGSNDNSESNTTTGADTGFSPAVLQYIALIFAFSLMVNVWIFFRISGGLFNPAVTFAMLLTRSITTVKFFLLLVAQLAGAIFSSYLVSVLFPTPLNVRTTLSADTSLARGVFIEAILTAELVFTIFMLAKEKHKATFIAPVGIGLALFIAELVGVYYTGGSLNPARSLGPCVVTGVFDREHWIYWIGPGIGAVLAVVFYKFIKILEYEMANPDQDADDKDMKEKNSM
ncbi:aquaporin-like protein [Lentithecium fluviatile CBS 122367]|uniref:Aquaporin-like protein n=1 Tax=Lentithecium fluviatile CBS 122367 TaxID=1168545 RepID=A0A6G1IHR7_9PLEO|nr:aquaporin-like protein [Lentithecium fluviatile CBS 122367]